MYTVSVLRPRQVRCSACGAEYMGWVRAEARSEMQYGSMGEGQARKRLEEVVESGKAWWQPYPCRCPKCGTFSPDTVWLVRGALVLLIGVVTGVTIAALVTREPWVAYFYVFGLYPVRNLVRFYTRKPSSC